MPLANGKLIGKYRHLLIPFSNLSNEAAALLPTLKLLQHDHRASILSDADLALRFIRMYAERRSGKTTAQIPGMPGMIFSILADWAEAKADLRLSEKPVSALVMLQAQAEGWRYVTISFDHAISGEPIEGVRDAFEFALHDLGHAYAFFKADYNPQGQVEFFNTLLSDLPTLMPYSEADTKFASDLEYCMADMNSHPQHLRQYLRGVIVEMFLRRYEHDEAELNALLESLSCLKLLQPVR